MKNQQPQVKLTLHEAINLVQTDYTELNNIKPSNYTKEEYEELCNSAIEENKLALEYVDPEHLDEDVYKEICKDAIEHMSFEGYEGLKELLNCVRKNSLTKQDYADICTLCINLLDYDEDIVNLTLIDDAAIDYLGVDLYVEICNRAVDSVYNLKAVKTYCFMNDKNDHYFNICMQATSNSSNALLFMNTNMLNLEQLKQIVLIAVEVFQDEKDHPLSFGCDDGQNYFFTDRLKGKPYEEICRAAVKKDPESFEHIKKDLLCADKAHSKNNEIYKKLALIAVESYKNTKLVHPLKFIQAKDFTPEDYKDICVKAVKKYPESFSLIDSNKFSKETYKQIENLAKNNNKIVDEQDLNDIINKVASNKEDLKDAFKIPLNKRPFNATTLTQENDEDIKPGKKQQVLDTNIIQLEQVDIQHDDSSAIGQSNETGYQY